MSSVIPSLASSISGSFAGVSKFAGSLQSVLNRAVGIAALPLQSLNAGLTTLNSRQSGLQSLESSFLTLQGSVSTLQTVLKNSLLNSSVSDGSIVSATVTAGALAGAYSIEVESLGSFSTAVSAGGSPVVTKPTSAGISSDTTLTLQVGASSTTITTASSSLSDLVDAINSQASDKVQATVVNLGSSGSPDYRLSLRAISLGSAAIGLTGTSGTLISTATAGTQASYKLNGLPTSIQSDSRTVTLAPGLTVELLSQSASGKATNITVANNTSAVSSALSTFARNYNSAVDAIAKNRGETGSALQGDSILLSLSNSLARLSGYSDGSPEGSLAAFGFGLDKQGHLSLDSTTFAAAAKKDFSAVLDVLGESTTGGFLKHATDLLGQIEDPVTGTIKTQTDTVKEAIALQNRKIAAQQDRLSTLQNNLTSQLSKADAAIARLESQVSYVTGIFAAFTKNSNSNNS